MSHFKWRWTCDCFIACTPFGHSVCLSWSGARVNDNTHKKQQKRERRLVVHTRWIYDCSTFLPIVSNCASLFLFQLETQIYCPSKVHFVAVQVATLTISLIWHRAFKSAQGCELSCYMDACACAPCLYSKWLSIIGIIWELPYIVTRVMPLEAYVYVWGPCEWSVCICGLVAGWLTWFWSR